MERKPKRLYLVEIFDIQSEIIRLQSEAIQDLLRLLTEYISAEEAEQLPCREKLKEAEKLQKKIK